MLLLHIHDKQAGNVVFLCYQGDKGNISYAPMISGKKGGETCRHDGR